MNAELVAQVCALPVGERMDLIEEILESLPDESEHEHSLSLSDEQRVELGRRYSGHLASPGSAVSWEEAQRQIRERFGVEL